MKQFKYLPSILHFTVNHNARVTLWDSQRAAETVEGEVYLPFVVPSFLYHDIIAAANKATDSDEGFAP